MARMQFGQSAFERAEGDLPQLPVINLFAEAAPTEETGVALQSRPGLIDTGVAMGNGPVDCLFQRDGVLDSELFGVANGALYQRATSLGAVETFGPASIAGNEIGIFACAGGGLRFWDGTAIATVTFPDSQNVRKVFTGASRVWAIADESGKLYFTDALDDDFDSLDFITAESLPDDLVDGLWLDDGAILFGKETVEFWPNTSDPDLPIAPLEGRVFEEGIRATGCAVVWDATFAWVTADHRVCVNGDKPQPISNPGLDAKIAASGQCALWTFELEGQEFLALRIDSGTYVFGNRNRLWSQFSSYGKTNWIPGCYAGGTFGSAYDGTLCEFGSAHLDFNGDLERRFRAGFALNAGTLTIDNLIVRANVGQTPFLTGDYTAPELEMRVSWDAGQTWDDWDSVSLGEQGEYDAKLMFAGVGMAAQPGFLAEFRLTAPVPFRASDVLINEPYGSR